MSKRLLIALAALCFFGAPAATPARAEYSAFILMELTGPASNQIILHNTSFRVDVTVEPFGPGTCPVYFPVPGDYMVATLKRKSTGALAGQSPNIPVTFTSGYANPAYTMMTAPDLGSLSADEYVLQVDYYSMWGTHIDVVSIDVFIQK